MLLAYAEACTPHIQYELEEKQKRIAASPGGLDPEEVFESLPESMKAAFEVGRLLFAHVLGSRKQRQDMAVIANIGRSLSHVTSCCAMVMDMCVFASAGAGYRDAQGSSEEHERRRRGVPH